MTTKQSLRQRATRFLFPVVGVLITYVVVFQMPQQKTLAERLAKHHKLHELVSRRIAEQSAASAHLAKVESEELALNKELDAAKSSRSRLITQRADRKAEVFSNASPATLVSQTLELLTRHGLECLDSATLATSSQAKSQALDTLKPVADLLGAIPGEENRRRQVRIALRGRFQDVRSAVRELQESGSGAFIVSVEMEAAGPRDASHKWILTISV